MLISGKYFGIYIVEQLFYLLFFVEIYNAPENVV